MGPIQHAFTEIFSETFFGRAHDADGTHFVEGEEGFFFLIDRLTAGQASQRVGDCSSIAAHVAHTRYYLWLTNESIAGRTPDADWEGSWNSQRVDESEWAELRKGLRIEVERLLSIAREIGPKSNDEVLGAFANVAHAAFHLGSVRQILRLISP